MPMETLSRFILLPELKLTRVVAEPSFGIYHAEKTSPMEVCPRCATASTTGYDRRLVKIKDSPIRGRGAFLWINKRRFFCKPCRKPFTEPIGGISKGNRTTERLKRDICWASDTFADLSKVRKAYRCSGWLVYKATYQQLELRRRGRLNYPWPKTIGIDEHFFKRCRNYGGREFCSIIVDYKNKRPFELVLGRSGPELRAALYKIPGRENVRWVNMDLCQPFRSFTKEFFPNSEIIADKFHVLRLLNPAINRRRKEITGDRRSNPIRRLLLRSGKRLEFFQKSAVYHWLEEHPELKEIYHYKESLLGFYRIKGFERASSAFTAMTDRMAGSALEEIKTLRKTLIRWRSEILNYFRTGLTNARVEGFNNKCNIIKTRGYGYRSFQNYRLRVLNG